MDTTTPTTIPEAILAARLNVPRESFKSWRDSGQLQETTHYFKEGRAYHLTAEGEAQVLHLIGITTPPPPPVKIEVLAQAAGVMPRMLRCKPADGGAMVTVRLTAPRVFATQFRRNTRLQVTPTDVDGVFEYDGQAPRRTRI